MSKPTIVQGEDTVFGRRYVCLTDHERLQAEVERLQAARAADKARIAELTEALGDLLAIVSDSAGVAGYHLNGAVAEWGEFGEIGAAFAALAQQGKDGEA